MPKLPPFEPPVELQAEPPVELQAEPPVELQVEHSSESVINEPLHVEEQDRTGAFYGFGENDFHPNHHEYEAEGGEFFDDENHKNAPTSANRRYPLRNRKPKMIQSMNLMDSNGQPFEPGSFWRQWIAVKPICGNRLFKLNSTLTSKMRRGYWGLYHLVGQPSVLAGCLK
ncbi:putative Importin subunit alpha-2/sw [Daphnia magna]|uniref:Putative Importin subunit alpha-2/sw n=1 Tax=Daphnia magna TaxID=35525 RepID=A0A164E2X2_9CRUS|nr:putative Importin subunit alpha-2/sw [Daphnia magna]